MSLFPSFPSACFQFPTIYRQIIFFIEAAYGGSSFVHTRVRTQLGHVIDHVIAFDKNTLAPVEISNGRNYDVFYEDITTDDATKK